MCVGGPFLPLTPRPRGRSIHQPTPIPPPAAPSPSLHPLVPARFRVEHDLLAPGFTLVLGRVAAAAAAAGGRGGRTSACAHRPAGKDRALLQEGGGGKGGGRHDYVRARPSPFGKEKRELCSSRSGARSLAHKKMMAASPTASALRLASTVRGAAVAAGRVTRVDGRTLTSPRRGVASAPVASWGGGRDGGDVNGPLADQRAPPPPQRAPLPPPPPPSPDSPPLPASRGRALQRTSSPSLTFRIAGVTFEGRQAAVAGLTPGQALRLVREPDNPADPAAVAVETLPGARLGYVPRDRTGEVFGGGGGCVCGDLGHVYGRVLSVGQAAPDEEEGGGEEGGLEGRVVVATARTRPPPGARPSPSTRACRPWTRTPCRRPCAPRPIWRLGCRRPCGTPCAARPRGGRASGAR